MITGLITDRIQSNKLISLMVIAQVGFLYQKTVESNVRLYMDSLPSFDEVYVRFMKFKVPFLKCNKEQDICLTLLFNPYFQKLYEKVLFDQSIITKNRKRFICKHLLESFADKYIEKSIMQDGVEPEYQRYCIESDIFKKSREILNILNK